MIHFKNKKSGFTLIEVLLACAILGVMLIPLYALQERAAQQIMKMARLAQRIFVVYDFFVTTQRPTMKEQKKIEKKSDEPALTMSYEKSKLEGKSSLAKQFNNLYLEKITWERTIDRTKEKDQFIAIVFEPPVPEPEKEEKETSGKKAENKTAQTPPSGAKK